MRRDRSGLIIRTLARNAKKCPQCGSVENAEAGPLTICQSCGEVLAESWALGDAVTDIVDGAEWLNELRKQGIEIPNSPPLSAGTPAIIGEPVVGAPIMGAPVVQPLSQPTPADEFGTIPGLIGPDTAVSMDSLMSELRGSIAQNPPAVPGPMMPPEGQELRERPRPQPVREINPARMTPRGGTKSISTEISIDLPIDARRVVWVPLTSPGVQTAVKDLIQGTGAELRKESIDAHPILAVHGLDANAALELRQRLERVGIPAKVREADPLPVFAPVAEKPKTSPKVIVLAAIAGALIGVAVLMLFRD